MPCFLYVFLLLLSAGVLRFFQCVPFSSPVLTACSIVSHSTFYYRSGVLSVCSAFSMPHSCSVVVFLCILYSFSIVCSARHKALHDSQPRTSCTPPHRSCRSARSCRGKSQKTSGSTSRFVPEIFEDVKTASEKLPEKLRKGAENEKEQDRPILHDCTVNAQPLVFFLNSL